MKITFRRRLYLGILLFALPIGVMHSQQGATATIQGIVVRSDSQPLNKVTVELWRGASPGPADSAALITQTDGDGKFYLPGVPPGQYRLVATSPGYVRAEYGQRHEGNQGQPLTLAAGQSVRDVRITMTAGAVISGRITERGQPVALADVVAVRPIYTEGQLGFVPVLADRTNDLGEYNLFWLPPGRYYIVAVVWDTASAVGFYVNPDGSDVNPFWAQRMEGRTVIMRALGTSIGENEAHVPFYYPGTTDSQAARIVNVQAGARLRGIDVDAPPLQTRRVTGTVTGLSAAATTGTQIVRAQVSLRPLNAANVNTNVAQAPNAQSDPSGNFEIPRAIPGRYMAIATAGNLIGRATVDIRDRDVTSVVVPLGPGLRVSGRVVIERQNPVSPDPALANLRVLLRTDPPMPGTPQFTVTPSPDGTFTIPAPSANAAVAPLGPPAGEYRVNVIPLLTVPLPPDGTPPAIPPGLQNAYVKSITFGGADALNDRLRLQNQTDDSLVIVIGTNPGALDGRVLDAQQQPASGTTVVLIHDDALRYRVNEKYTSSDLTGRFQFQNVPPGNYKLFAWEKIDKAAWNDPGLMQDYERYGIPVRIEAGAKISVDLKAIP
jgi:hypothetical protein